MAPFRFRLEAKLKLTERELEDTQKELADEIRQWQNALDERNQQQRRLGEAISGQKQACHFNPQALGLWQTFVRDQLELLREKERVLAKREQLLELARLRVIEAHREAEKFTRLKHKRHQEFIFEEQRKEQALIDDIAQRRFGGLKN